jgi:uncharacterized protein involved in exopolysaccharide biosynthesis/Mrp family chromosome partitioning ATPase
MGQVYFTLFRHWRLIAACTLVGIAAAAVFFFLTPKVYRSEAKLLVRYVTEMPILDPTASGGRVLSPDRNGENIINSEVEILASRDLAEQVVEDIGVQRFNDETNQADKAYATLSVQRSLHIELPRRSNVIRLSYDALSPELAQVALASLVQNYLRKHIEIHRAAGAYDFLAQQTDQVRARLADTEEELRKLKNEAGVVSIDDTKRAIVSRLDELNRALQYAEGELAATQARLSIMHPTAVTTTAPSSAAAAPAATNGASGSRDDDLQLARLYEKLARLQDREMEMLATYTEDSIPVRNLRTQIDDVRRLITSAAPSGRPIDSMLLLTNTQSTLISEEANLAALQARMNVLRDQIEATRQQARKFEEIEGRIVLLERNREIQDANFKYFSRSLEQARIDDALDADKITNISIVQPATIPAQVIRPNLMRNVGASLALGVVLGVGLAFVRDRILDHSIKRPDEVEAQLKIPLLLSIPRLSLNGHAAHGATSGGGREELTAYHEALRDRVLSGMGALPGRGPCLVGVTSCSRGSGVSTTAAGLAMMLARNGDERVLLLDADPSRNGGKELYGINPVAGVTDIVPNSKGKTAVIERNLYYLAAAQQERSETALSVMRNFTEMMMGIKDEYAYVVIDLLPVTETSPTLRISPLLHGIVLVVEAEKDHREAARRAKDLLAQSKARVIGAVLNKTRSYVPSWLHPTY